MKQLQLPGFENIDEKGGTVAGQSIWELRNDNKRLRTRVTFLEGRLKIKDEFIKTLEHRLSRMAERLTGLAAERNTLYAASKEHSRIINHLRDERESLIERLEEAERRVFELEEVE